MNENVIIIISIALLVITVALIRFMKSRRRLPEFNLIFSEAAGALNLRFMRGSLFHFPKIYGTLEDHNVTIQNSHFAEDNNELLYFSVVAGSSVEGSIEIKKRSESGGVRKSLFEGNEITGDNDFDSKIEVVGMNPCHRAAFLKNSIRDKIIGMADSARDFEISATEISCCVNKSYFFDAESLIEYIQSMIAVSKELRKRKNIKEKLLENITLETVPGARIVGIRSLLSAFPSVHKEVDDETRQFLLSIMKNDISYEVQVEAAKNLGNEGLRHLVMLLDSAAYKNFDLDVDIVEILKEKNYKASIPVLTGLFQKSTDLKFRNKIIETFTVFAEE
ncbi:MAG: hypothetical protein GY754_24035 [bacterium]|nr:hypothetical protein [bacterium]